MIDNWRDATRARYEKSYALIWDRIFNELKTEVRKRTEDTLWLQSASGYIFSTVDVRWAMDLRLPTANSRDQLVHRLKDDMGMLDFIILTHEHEDHCDLKTIQAASEADVHWIIPEFFDKQPLYDAGLSNRNITWIKPGDCIEIQGIRIEAFISLHFMNSQRPGVPEMGYLIDTGNKRMLFPCDVREYAPEKLPHFDNVDILFAHVWLGVGNALNFPWEDYLDAFCRFMNATGAKKILLTHLYDVGRSIQDMWTYSHAGLAMDGLLSLNPALEIVIPQVGIPHVL